MAVAVLLSLGSAAQAAGQIIERPERPIRGLFGGGPPPDPARTGQELTLTLDSLWGYDDNPPAPGGVTPFTSREPGYTGFVSAALRYGLGRQARSVEVRGRGYMNSFRNQGLEPSYGADVQALGIITVGRRHQATLSQNVSSDPFYALGTFGPLRRHAGPDLLPDANLTNGYYVRRSLDSSTALSFESRWSPRDRVSAAYRYDVRDFRDTIGDGHGKVGTVDYGRTLGRRSGMRLSYRHMGSEYGQIDETTRPFGEDGVELGYQYERKFSPVKRWSVALGGGATYVTTLDQRSQEPLQFTLPSGYGTIRFDLARTWSIRADYRRALSVIEGLVTQSFATDAAMVSLGGFAGRRSELTFSGGYSTGIATAGSTGAFQSYSGTSQLRYLFSRTLTAVVSHTLYAYRLDGVADLLAGVPESLVRNTVRAGITVDLSLFGTYTSGGPRVAGD